MAESNAVFIAALKPREFNFKLVSISREFFLESTASAHTRNQVAAFCARF